VPAAWPILQSGTLHDRLIEQIEPIFLIRAPAHNA
jgi:hypothetical protein